MRKRFRLRRRLGHGGTHITPRGFRSRAEGGKPGSVSGTSPPRPSLWDAGYPTPLAAYPELERDGQPLAPVWPCSQWGLSCRGRLRRARWALTPPFHPCLCGRPKPSAIGGLFSVTLSVASRRPGVTRHRALWSPDFPRAVPHGRPAASSPSAAPWTVYTFMGRFVVGWRDLRHDD